MNPKNFKSDITDIEIISENRSGRVKALAKVSWNDGPYKHTIRNIDVNEEPPRGMKGIDLSESEMHNLATLLVQKGFGYIEDITDAIKDREENDETKLESFEKIFTDEKENKYTIKLK